MKINLGSGQRPFGSGWTNIDYAPRWNPDIVADGADLHMIADNSVEIVALVHTLEHYGCGEGDAMLRECHRILRPGASLIVLVPDMYELARGWLAGRISTQVYLTNVYGAYMGAEADRHKWGFTGITLHKTLTEAGFATVKPFDWRTLADADMPGKDWWQLGMEAIK